MTKLLAYPLGRNPYQRLLYDALVELHPELTVAYCSPVYRLGAIGVPAQLLTYRLRGYRILHIHWPDFRIPRWVPFRERLAVKAPRAILRFAHAIGFAIVWTVHEVLPHGPRTIDDVAVARDLADVMDAGIALSPATVAAMREEGLPTDRVTVIPHGNYIDAYPASRERSYARDLLDLPKDAFVILAFGLMRPYKGLEDLVEVVRASTDESLRLVIAGGSLDPGLLARLRDAATDKRVVLREGYVPESDVPPLFGAADVMCAPFRSLTTSGSVILAFSLGCPIVAPRVGNIADLPGGIGFLYEPGDPDGLAGALREARASDRLQEMGAAALAYAETLSWPEIAETTWKVYEQVTAWR